ncbi:MAG: slipin family protein [Coriobacteriales bacterium]|nr:slipin family protein [Coriobacteriales bacterium]
MKTQQNQAQDTVQAKPTASHHRLEKMNSPKGHQTNNNASNVFSIFIACIAFCIAFGVFYAFEGTVSMLGITVSFIIAVIAACSLHIASEWERAVILRLGRLNRVAGPGFFLTIPFIEHISLRADLRMMMTSFSAEETLTSDLVPVNVDAVLFWMVWDAQKACTEVEDYHDAVALTAQTALREAIGRRQLADVTTHRDQLDAEINSSIESKTSAWGVSIVSVEIRDIVIPKELQDVMAATAAAERQKDSRIVLAEVEADIAEMLVEAAEVYHKDELAFELRSLHLLSEGVNHGKGTLVVPSSFSEGFNKQDK